MSSATNRPKVGQLVCVGKTRTARLRPKMASHLAVLRKNRASLLTVDEASRLVLKATALRNMTVLDEEGIHRGASVLAARPTACVARCACL